MASTRRIAATFLALAATLLPATSVQATPGAAAASAASDKPLKGRGLKVKASARGPEWAGARKVAKTVVYRIDGTKDGDAKGFRRARPMRGKRAASAEYVLSRFGLTRNQVKAAAVEMAVQALVSPGQFGLGTDHAKNRAAAMGAKGAKVHKQATRMKALAKRYRGPYTTSATLPATRLNTGVETTLTARVRSRRGVGVPGVKASFTLPDGSLRSARTDDTGEATLAFTPNTVGPGVITTTFKGLAAPALTVRKAKRKRKAARVALAGLTRPLTVTTPIHGLAVPKMDVDMYRSITELNSREGGGQYFITGVAAPYTPTVTMTLYGPGADNGCDGPIVGSYVRTAGSNARYPITGLLEPAPGQYRWLVSAAADGSNAPVAVCGPAFTVVPTTPALTLGTNAQVSFAARSASLGTAFEITVGTYNAAPTTAVATLYASSSGCSGPVVATKEVTVTGRGFYTTGVVVTTPGKYVWGITTTPEPGVGTLTACGAATTVRWE